MARLSQINQYEQKKAQQQPSAMPASMAPPQEAAQGVPTTPVTPLSTEVRKESMGQAYTNEPQVSLARPMEMQKPVLRTMDPKEVLESQRNNYMQSFGTWAEAEKRGDISQQDWANAKIQEMVAKGENPGDYLNVLAMLGETESPDEKAKRERREQLGEVFSNLGNLIGNAANLYYTNKGGQYIDLNTQNEKHRERMQRIKDKQDALKEQYKNIIINAKLGDAKAARDEKLLMDKMKAEQAAKDRDNAFKLKFNAYMKELDNAYKMGQIDAQTAANLKRDAEKAKTSKELEDYKQKNREALAESNHERIIKREEARGGGSRATIRVPRKDGTYDEYRKNDLTNPIVISQIYNSLPDDYKSKDKYSEPTLLTMQAAIGKALTDGKITEISPEIELTGKGEEKQAPYKKKKKKENRNTPPQKV